jgi:ubiquinol oxidase
MWQTTLATQEAINYWQLPEGAKIREVLLAIRADELMHRELNHHLGDIN